MKPDGSGAKALTQLTASGADSGLNSPPAWSPDGSKIAFESSRALDGSNNSNIGSIGNIWVINADGSNARPLTQLTATGSFRAVWSPDGSKIAFTSGRALDGSDNANTSGASVVTNIWLMNADGSGVKPLTQLTARLSESDQPVWSPDGSKIAFTSSRALDGSNNSNSAANIWVVNADGSGARALTQLTAREVTSLQPVWSPDGTKIAFASDRALDGSDANNFSLNIWVMNADGSGAKPLTQLTATTLSDQPVWSPDSSKIAFASSRALDGSNNFNPNQTTNIWIVNADGSGTKALTQITANGAESEQPVSSPDGSKIVFTSFRTLDGSNNQNTNDTGNIWIVNADGSSVQALTQLNANRANSENPSVR
jgi:Tol biopolymer transport system component